MRCLTFIRVLTYQLIIITGLLGCTNTPSQSASEQDRHTVNASDARVVVEGRVVRTGDGGLLFGYPGVSLHLRVNAASLTLLAKSTGPDSYLEYRVNSRPPQTVKLSRRLQAIPIINNPQAEEHRVTITHRSETWHGEVTIEGFEVGDGALLAPPRLPQRRLLLIGDSVTCGEGVDRPRQSAQCQKDNSWWNPRASYGLVLAERLDAQAHLICYGGRGLMRSWDGRSDQLQAPDFFDLAIPEPNRRYSWNHQQYQPDLILVSLGTNDFNPDHGPYPRKEDFVATYVEFAHKLLRVHSRAQIVITEGPMVSDQSGERRQKTTLVNYLSEVVERVDHPRLSYLPSQHYPGDDCDAHPTQDQHRAMAADWLPSLKSLLNW